MSDDRLSLVSGALADPIRQAILTSLAEGQATVAELAAPFSVSQPAISKHLKVLENAGPGLAQPAGDRPAQPTGGRTAARGDHLARPLPAVLG